MVKMVAGFLGCLLPMFNSDYPHFETLFPGSVDLVLGRKGLNENLLPKIMWENAEKCFGEPDKEAAWQQIMKHGWR